MSNRIPDVRRLLSQQIEKQGIMAVHRLYNVSTTCLYRYEAGEREIPFTLGWLIYRAAGKTQEEALEKIKVQYPGYRLPVIAEISIGTVKQK